MTILGGLLRIICTIIFGPPLPQQTIRSPDFSARNQNSVEWGAEPLGKVAMLSPQAIPFPVVKCRPCPIIPDTASVPRSFAESAPVSSLVASSR